VQEVEQEQELVLVQAPEQVLEQMLELVQVL